jgi:hypothetical protein
VTPPRSEGSDRSSIISILVVLPVASTSCNLVARSNKSGKLVVLDRYCVSKATIFNGGGRGLIGRVGPMEVDVPFVPLRFSFEELGLKPRFGDGERDPLATLEGSSLVIGVVAYSEG